jgi:hypothetical protein
MENRVEVLERIHPLIQGGGGGGTGPQGPQGPAGAPGAPGSKWFSGGGAPAVGLGVNGDYYLDIDNGDVWSKTAGAWVKIGNIEGPPGTGGGGAGVTEGTDIPANLPPGSFFFDLDADCSGGGGAPASWAYGRMSWKADAALGASTPVDGTPKLVVQSATPPVQVVGNTLVVGHDGAFLLTVSAQFRGGTDAGGSYVGLTVKQTGSVTRSETSLTSASGGFWINAPVMVLLVAKAGDVIAVEAASDSAATFSEEGRSQWSLVEVGGSGGGGGGSGGPITGHVATVVGTNTANNYQPAGPPAPGSNTAWVELAGTSHTVPLIQGHRYFVAARCTMQGDRVGDYLGFEFRVDGTAVLSANGQQVPVANSGVFAVITDTFEWTGATGDHTASLEYGLFYGAGTVVGRHDLLQPRYTIIDVTPTAGGGGGGAATPGGRVIGSARIVANAAPVTGTATDVSGLSVKFTAEANRKYLVSISCPSLIIGGQGASEIQVSRNGVQIAARAVSLGGAAGTYVGSDLRVLDTPGAGEVTYAFRVYAQSGVTITLGAGPQAPSSIVVEDASDFAGGGAAGPDLSTLGKWHDLTMEVRQGGGAIPLNTAGFSQRWCRIGDTVFVNAFVTTAGAGTAGSAVEVVLLNAPPFRHRGAGEYRVNGTGYIFRYPQSPPTEEGVWLTISANGVALQTHEASTGSAGSTPSFALAAGHRVALNLTYECEP